MKGVLIMTKIRLTLIPILIILLFTFLVGIVIAKEDKDASDDEKVVKILRTTNKAQVLSYVPVVYTFKNVNPHEVVNWFTSALATEEGGCFTFVAPDGNSGKMLIICPEHQIPYFDQMAKDLDRPKLNSAPGSRYIYYRFKHRNPYDAGLMSVLGTQSNEVLAPDRETNAVLLFDAPAGADKGKDYLEKVLDIPTPMAEIALKVYEVNVANNAAMGLDYIAWKNGPGKTAANFTYNLDIFASKIPGNKTSQSGSYGYYIDYPSAYFDFLVSKSRAKILIDTKLSSMNGTPINFLTGDQVLYFAKDTANNLTVSNAALEKSSRNFNLTALPNAGVGNSAAQADIDYSTATQPAPVIRAVNSGIDIYLTPAISEERINMNLIVRVADLVGYQDNGTPIINSKQMSDSIMVPYNTEVMIGDLTREYIVKSTKKVPFFGSLPVLGWLFGGENQIKQKSVAIVSIKANLINDLSNITDKDKKIINQVANKADTPSPKPLVGFDQWLLDNER